MIWGYSKISIYFILMKSNINKLDNISYNTYKQYFTVHQQLTPYEKYMYLYIKR